MTLRTPRRRISPRAKRKYRVIRDFFRRALGSPSQQDIKINSSIALNVTDLKHKIIGLEHDINAVSRNCQNYPTCFESSLNGAESAMLEENYNETLSAVGESLIASAHHHSSGTEYRPTESRYRKSEESDYERLLYQSSDARRTSTAVKLESTSRLVKDKHNKNNSYEKVHEEYDYQPNPQRYESLPQNYDSISPKYETAPQKHKSQTMREKLSSACLSCSFHSLRHGRGQGEHRRDSRRSTSRRRKHAELPFTDHHKHHAHKGQAKRNKSDPVKCEEKHSHKKREARPKVDEDFLADIIRKQYKPVTVFGKKQSNLSQFSVPVCRDYDYSVPLATPELCSCCCEPAPQYPHGSPGRPPHDFGDIRSMCDTRLHNYKRSRPRRHNRYMEDYNDAAYYDVVPVKERSNSKSRRKMVEDDMYSYECYYKEVPPSPRTHRPRLNLKAQHNMEYDDYEIRHARKHKKHLTTQSDITTKVVVRKTRKDKHNMHKSTKESIAEPNVVTTSTSNEQGNMSAMDNAFKTPITDRSDKTDKALCEIKDILQSFLQEIKKETVPLQNKNCSAKQMKKDASASDNTGTNTAAMASNHAGPSAGATHEAAPGCNVCNGPQCSAPPNVNFPNNPCCCPMFPMYPMNYMPSAYVVPSHSFSCHACVNASTKDAACQECSKHKKDSMQDDGMDKNIETEILIKEIYKFVAQNPNAIRKKSRSKMEQKKNDSGDKILTSRSVGGSSLFARHDMKVGTPALRCYSKSCEAIGSRMITETFTNTNATHSDTILEKMNIEMPTTTSDTELHSYYRKKPKISKFGKVLKSMGLFKKKKKEILTTETESSYELQEMQQRPPFRQEITNYMMHAQEFAHTPPPLAGHVHRAKDPNYRLRDMHYHHGDPHYQHANEHYRSGEQHYRPGDPHYRPTDHNYRPGDPHYTTPDPHGYDPGGYGFPPPGYHTCPPFGHHVHGQTIHEHGAYTPPPRNQLTPSSYYSPYENLYTPESSQLPVCLKEIEVKSTGTQSERKVPFFHKLGKRTPSPRQTRAEPRATDAQSRVTSKSKSKTKKPQPMVEPAIPSLFSGWQKFKEKVKTDIQDDPMAYGFTTHKHLRQGDVKIRNAMLKKLFYKRNPFSPNNLIIKTILGNDSTTLADQQMRMRPRLFF